VSFIRLVKWKRHIDYVHIGLSVSTLPFLLYLLVIFASLDSTGEETNFKHLKFLWNPIVVLLEKFGKILAATGNHSPVHPKKSYPS